MHKDIIINSDKLNSAQGSVFYVKQKSDINKELVLKIYDKEDMHSYLKEAIVMDKLEELSLKEKIEGFPKVISKI